MSIVQAEKSVTVTEPLKISTEMDLEFEEELKKLKAIQNEVAEKMSWSSNSPTCSIASSQSLEEKIDADERSVYVANVRFGSTASSVKTFFEQCGSVARVTIPTEKFTNRPKGHAFVEFEQKEAVLKAIALSGSVLFGRPITVCQKRTNQPGMGPMSSSIRGSMRGRGRGGFGGAGSNVVIYKYVVVPGPGRAQRGGFRPRGRHAYAPY